MKTSQRSRRSRLLLAGMLVTAHFGMTAEFGQAQTTPGSDDTVTVTDDSSTWITPLTGNAVNIPAGADGVVINNQLGGRIISDSSAVNTEANTTVNNGGRIQGDVNGINFVNGLGSGTVNNAPTGEVLSNSRAINIGGQVEINNAGAILGTGDQRNGTVYSDSSSQQLQY